MYYFDHENISAHNTNILFKSFIYHEYVKFNYNYLFKKNEIHLI